eukprot:5740870-Amphidinium_carterae.1
MEQTSSLKNSALPALSSLHQKSNLCYATAWKTHVRFIHSSATCPVPASKFAKRVMHLMF